MYHIIVNPEGGKGKSLKALAKVEQILKDRNVEYVVHKTEYPRHATEITRELSATPDTNIIMMGGDGSFNEILNGKRPVSTEYALLLEAALGIDANIWLGLQADYNLQKIKQDKSFLKRIAEVRKVAAVF